MTTFFYKKKDNTIIAMEEREASLTGKFYEHIGTSDGKTFQNIISEPKNKMNELQVEMNEYLKAGDKVPKTLHTKFTKAKLEFQKASKLAFEEELKVAIANGTSKKPGSTEWSSFEGQNNERPKWI